MHTAKKNRLIGYNRNNSLILLLLFTLQVIFVSGQFNELSLNRKINNKRGYKEIVYVTDKTPIAKGKRSYHWYKSLGIHSSQNNYAGELLDGPYIKYYPGHQLAEKGYFTKGLKTALWTTWHQNGKVSSVMRWKNGRRSGKYIARDSLGSIVELGNYKKGFKNGKWILPLEGRTLYFKKGKLTKIDSTSNDSVQKKPSFFKGIFSKKEKIKEDSIQKDTVAQPNFFKRLFTKKDGKNKKQKQKPKNATIRKAQKSNPKTTKKEGFFKRLFRKKNKKTTKTNA